MKTKGEEQIDALMEQLDPASERYRILASAKRFKSSWVELGEKLLQVQSSDAFRTWGYASFDEYCSREVRIRRPTAEKLTQAYRFLEREEPELLARQTELRPLPDFRSVDLLRQARELPGIGEEDYRNLHDTVLEGNLGHATVARHFREVTAPLRTTATQEPLRRVWQAARRLQQLLDDAACAEEAELTMLQGIIARLEEQLAVATGGES